MAVTDGRTNGRTNERTDERTTDQNVIAVFAKRAKKGGKRYAQRERKIIQMRLKINKLSFQDDKRNNKKRKRKKFVVHFNFAFHLLAR
jgi:hypothetical protein